MKEGITLMWVLLLFQNPVYIFFFFLNIYCFGAEGHMKGRRRVDSGITTQLESCNVHISGLFLILLLVKPK